MFPKNAKVREQLDAMQVTGAERRKARKSILQAQMCQIVDKRNRKLEGMPGKGKLKKPLDDAASRLSDKRKRDKH